MKRRNFLKVAGGGVILAAGAAGGYALTRTPTKALVPWDEAGTLSEEPRRKALSYAILAPNPHNRQPWLVDLSEPSTVRLLVDRTRLLPETDPFGRQIVIGLGCFLELLRMAGAEQGYRVEIEAFPAGADRERLDDRLVALARFVEDSTVPPDPLFAQVLLRRSLKEPFDTGRRVPDEALTALTGVVRDGVAVGATNDHTHVAALRALTHEALDIEIKTPRTYKESVDLFRIGKAEVEANPDGIDFSGLMFDSLAALGLFTREIALDQSSSGFQQGYAAMMATCDTAMGHVWLITHGNGREDQIRAGRDWLRVNLAATAVGLGTQPLSQALQEYPEMARLYEQIHATLAPGGGTVQMLARLGYGPEVPPSPRWQLEERILKAS